MQNDLSWDDLRVLVEVARHRSLFAAARALKVAPSTISRRLDALERALGRALVHRSSAGTSLEPEAQALVALAQQLEDQLGAYRRDDGAPSSYAGTVRLSVPESFAAPVAKVLAHWRGLHPETQVELVAERRLADVSRREVDLALRTARSQAQTLVERKLGVFALGLYASESYLERRARDGHLRVGDFARHDFVGFDGALRQFPQEQFLVSHGATRFPFRSTSDAAILSAAAAGQGICVSVEVYTHDYPTLRRLQCDVALPEVTVWLVLHRDLRKVPRVRGVAQLLEASFRDLPGNRLGRAP